MRWLVLVCCAAAVAAGPPRRASDRVLIEDAATEQVRLKRRYEAWQGRMMLLAARWAEGTAAEQASSKALRAALKRAADAGLSGRYDALIEALLHKDASRDLDLLSRGLATAAEVRKALRELTKAVPKHAEVGDEPAKLEKEQEAIVALLSRVRRERLAELLRD